MKITRIQSEALELLTISPLLIGTNRITPYLAGLLDKNRLIVPVHVHNTNYWHITDAGRITLAAYKAEEAAKRAKKLARSANEASKNIKNLGAALKTFVIILMTLFCVQLPAQDISNYFYPTDSTMFKYSTVLTTKDIKTVTDTVPCNFLVSALHATTVQATQGYAIRQGLKLGNSWITSHDGYFFTYTKYLGDDKKPISENLIIWQAKPTEK